ncbi:hypothetical protein HanRHA438_Chr15g0700341 [Helianthus annuus]|uniref:Transmembrane protein n=1 Tax=Helianthus annuus TaxID=4232 RepID=A0A9K3H1S3_HELAN|nr:hypothetical protein HanXRQr2_Chr15g0688061 [Helianthus annuus]KAJ0450820.1 hypothetical protein HanHA300_Chr15g0560571 [Helianthus annuus]KAJ0472680.1 hypothetical protein HanHA89_Chr15g0609781 [Helianthus annuus]KAJ0648284.1 hypothetical protein HanLR1_Chr15g0571161 [Helianthus annuus]KAJ0652123.1 hypothetical protein HanOQP8_Chr15g0568581 [Helianthus annuus]
MVEWVKVWDDGCSEEELSLGSICCLLGLSVAGAVVGGWGWGWLLVVAGER